MALTLIKYHYGIIIKNWPWKIEVYSRYLTKSNFFFIIPENNNPTQLKFVWIVIFNVLMLKNIIELSTELFIQI